MVCVVCGMLQNHMEHPSFDITRLWVYRLVPRNSSGYLGLHPITQRRHLRLTKTQLQQNTTGHSFSTSFSYLLTVLSGLLFAEKSATTTQMKSKAPRRSRLSQAAVDCCTPHLCAVGIPGNVGEEQEGAEAVAASSRRATRPRRPVLAVAGAAAPVAGLFEAGHALGGLERPLAAGIVYPGAPAIGGTLETRKVDLEPQDV